MAEGYKDGVTLMAEAIRREQEEALKEAQKKTGKANVSDATAQFSNKSTATAQPSTVQTSTSTPSQTATATESSDSSPEPDGTMYTEASRVDTTVS